MKFVRDPGRLAGLLYLTASVPGFFALLYVPNRLFVHGDAAATAGRIAASETLFRLGIAAGLFGQALFIFVALALYRLLKGVNQWHAAIMLALILVAAPIAFLNEGNSIAALELVRGSGFLGRLESPQRAALAMLFLRVRGAGFDIAGIFWGLWLVPLGLLVYRSGFIPRVLGILLIIACPAYLANSFTSLVFPSYQAYVSRWMGPLQLTEMVFMLWLLIRGAAPKPEFASTVQAG